MQYVIVNVSIFSEVIIYIWTNEVDNDECLRSIRSCTQYVYLDTESLTLIP